MGVPSLAKLHSSTTSNSRQPLKLHAPAHCIQFRIHCLLENDIPCCFPRCRREMFSAVNIARIQIATICEQRYGLFFKLRTLPVRPSLAKHTSQARHAKVGEGGPNKWLIPSPGF
ncbi:hypothetical protein BaRGS_00017585 [Batillaria attramentaria]|uniref:Uncharacterized protein n=1 Tax=Batillaria attramentaria TaxID=370345 RepID=A0ABD0KW63_9CAEN